MSRDLSIGDLRPPGSFGAFSAVLDREWTHGHAFTVLADGWRKVAGNYAQAEGLMLSYLRDNPEYGGNVLIKRGVSPSEAALSYGDWSSTSCPDTVRWSCTDKERVRRRSLPDPCD